MLIPSNLTYSTLYTLYCEVTCDNNHIDSGVFYRFTFGVSIAIYYCEVLFVYLVFADRSVLVDNR